MASISTHISGILDDMAPLMFSPDFGFDAFSEEDVLAFLSEPSRWSLAFNKAKGKGILYGLPHVQQRRRFLNDLPINDRLTVMLPKCDFFHIKSKIERMLQRSVEAIVDVCDIGMGHSVYRIDVISNSLPTSVVVKQEEQGTQAFFTNVLSMLEWPTFVSVHVSDEDGAWEITDYLGTCMLGDYVLNHRPENVSEIIRQLAYHAALGDILGRGDRHLENYLLFNGNVLAIDISYLFWDGNEDWLWEYVAGGLAEINWAYYLHRRGHDSGLMASFWTHYNDAMIFLRQRQTKLEAMVSDFYGAEDLDTERKITFLNDRLSGVDAYIDSQRRLVDSALCEYEKRLSMKTALRKKVGDVMSCGFPADISDREKMYVLSDYDRISAFYLYSGDGNVLGKM